MTDARARHAFGGIYASTICAMMPDGALDETATGDHFRAVLATEGMAGLLVNGHAGENYALDEAELSTVVRLARSTAGGARIVAGINAERADVAARMAEEAATQGADAVMVFPPYSWALGADPRVVVSHHEIVAMAVGLPVFLFQGSINAGRTAYAPDLLARLLEIDAVVGIKEGSWETAAYERTRRLTRRLRPDVGVMASGDEHLFACFAIGSEGSLVSLAAVVPDLVVALDRAVATGDLSEGRALHERLYELARVVYGPPGHLAAVRLKTCLVELGRLPAAHVRAPGVALSGSEVAELRSALSASGVPGAAPASAAEA
jgi:4-hydroxy-tetrahydrodipicolinate synthase